MKELKKLALPADGWAGLKENFSTDAMAGFSVFLLALPLSLGIAKAGGIPPVMGLLSAVIGGLIVSFISGSRLTIKGPAAGLIVIVAGAVTEFGGGEMGWHLAAGTMVVAGVIQILFGVLKFGKLVDFFPLSAIHGMLAAIGIIIIVKQIPVLLDINPAETKGLSIFELTKHIFDYFNHLDSKASFIGFVSLAIMMSWGKIKQPLISKIPAPLVVLIFAIPTELFMDFKHTEPEYALVHVGNVLDSITFNASFKGISQTGIFVKYVIMFALVGSLESLLTVKAVDLLDPYKRKSNNNKDLIAVGVGNTLGAVLGAYPMIAEVARSSANVSIGAKTRWANFFHGLFMLIFLLLGVAFIEMIPNAALAAMLITVGIRLAHPKEFVNTFKIGKEQLAIFLITIIFTLIEDLLVGIAAGIVLKMIFSAIHGAPLSSFFKAPTMVAFEGDKYVVTIDKAAMFTNVLGINRKLAEIPPGFNITIDLSRTKLVDHTVMESLHHFIHDYEAGNGTAKIIGLDEHMPLGKSNFAARKKKK